MTHSQILNILNGTLEKSLMELKNEKLNSTAFFGVVYAINQITERIKDHIDLETAYITQECERHIALGKRVEEFSEGFGEK